MRTVEPKARERLLARRGFGLRYFIVVMHGDLFDAARVDVYLRTQRRPYHCGALDVPPWETKPPRAFPAEFLVRFPKQEIRRGSFISCCRDTGSRAETFEINLTQFSVFRKARGIEVDTRL